MIGRRSGYICISVPEQRLKELDIKMMVPENQERHKTAYTVTVDAAEGESLYLLARGCIRIPLFFDSQC